MIRSENSLKKDLKGFLLQGLFMLIFFVLFFIPAILPTLTTFVKKRITKVVKWHSNYSNSQSSICFMVLPQCFSFKTVRFWTVLHVFAMFLSDCIVILLSATYTAPLKIHLPTITFYPLIFPLYFNFHSSKKLRNLP